MEVACNASPDNISSFFFLKHLAWINVFWFALVAYTLQSLVLGLSEGVSTECSEEEVKCFNEVCSPF